MTDRRTAAIALGLFSAAFVAGGILLGDASGMLGDSDTTHTILQADRTKTSLKLRNDEQTQQVLKPS